jgi:hypothetical protein
VTIWSQPLDLAHVRPRVGSLDNAKHVPAGGNVRIFSEKPKLDHVRARVGSLDNKSESHHTALH